MLRIRMGNRMGRVKITRVFRNCRICPSRTFQSRFEQCTAWCEKFSGETSEEGFDRFNPNPEFFYLKSKRSIGNELEKSTRGQRDLANNIVPSILFFVHNSVTSPVFVIINLFLKTAIRKIRVAKSLDSTKGMHQCERSISCGLCSSSIS